VEVGEVKGTDGVKVPGFDEAGRVAVPTVRTGREENVVSGHEDSMVEEVGRMVDEIELQVGGRRGEEESQQMADGEEKGEDAPNPMKRMWEEDEEAAKHAAKEAAQEARIRDEL
jgi:protein transport protein SEC20